MAGEWPSGWRSGRPCHKIQASPYLNRIAETTGKLPNYPALRIHAINHAREGNDFANVFGAANPGDRALQAHSEAGVRNTAVAPKIEIPLERFFGQVVFAQAPQEQIVIVDALAAADDFAVTFRSDHVEGEASSGRCASGCM